MPYKIIPLGDSRFRVINKDTGRVTAKNTTRKKAVGQLRLLYFIEHGGLPRSRLVSR